MIKLKLILLAIFILALSIRLVGLGSIPASLNRDEAALGYNAYLLLSTGQDEWGKSWPIFLQSFGDYKLPGYVMALLPLIHFFGLQDWVVRFPSALSGSLLILPVYFFATNFIKRKWLALTVPYLIAISPVFIFFSRVGFEANVALLLFMTSLWLLVGGRWKRDLAALVLLFLASITYNTPLFLLPFVAVFIAGMRGFKNPRKYILPVLGMTLLFVGMMAVLLPVTAQKGSITLLSDETTWMNWVTFRQSLSDWQKPLLGSRYLYVATQMLSNLWNSFSYSFLVEKGGQHPWHTLPSFGHVLLSVYVLSLFGILVSIKRTFLIGFLFFNRRIASLKKIELEFWLLFLTLASLVPAIITVDAPHATRSLLFFVLLVIWTVIGLERILDLKILTLKPLNTTYIQVVLLSLFIISTSLFSFTYVQAYFSWSKQEQASWQPGLSQALRDPAIVSADKVAILDPEGYAYILVAWYAQLDPKYFLETIIHQQANAFGFHYGEQVGKFHFIVNQNDRIPTETATIEWEEAEKKWVVSSY